jgi:hypothetical protein
LTAGIVNVAFLLGWPVNRRTDQRGDTLAGTWHHGVCQRRGSAFALFSVAVLCHMILDVWRDDTAGALRMFRKTLLLSLKVGG